MRSYRSQSLSAGRVVIALPLIAQYASALALSNNSSVTTSSNNLSSSTATSYAREPVSILLSGAGIVVDSTKTISFVGSTTEAVYSLLDGCVISAIKQKSSVVIIPATTCLDSLPQTLTATSSASTEPALSSGSSVTRSSSVGALPTSSSIDTELLATTSSSDIQSSSSSHDARSSSNAIPALSSSSSVQYSSSSTYVSSSPSSNLSFNNSSIVQISSGTQTTSSNSINSLSATRSISGTSNPSSHVGDSSSATLSGVRSSSFLSATNAISSSLATSSGGSSSPAVTIGIITSIIVQSGTTVKNPILTGGDITAPITLPPVTTTLASSQAVTAVSSVSSQLAGLVPVIVSWKKDPAALKTDTLDKVNGIKGVVVDLISDLGSKPSSTSCGSKRKRGLLGLIGDVVKTLVCITDELDSITKNINADDIEGVDGIVDNLTSETEELTDEKDDKTDSQTESETESSCTSRETAFQVTVLCGPTTYTTDGSTVSTTTCSSTATITTTGCTVTGTTTTISSSASISTTQTPCASGTCGGGACPINAGGPLSGAKWGVIATTEDCASISTTTTSVLPTASYGAAGGGTVTGASKRELPNVISNHNETLIDDSISLLGRTLPDVTSYSDYITFLSQYTSWVSQAGSTTGYWYDYPVAGHIAVGVNGIYGCTAVVIISEKGVYLSHIWEVPVFLNRDSSPTDDAFFTQTAFNALRDGTATAQSITALVGTEEQPGVLNAIYAPTVFVLTPFTSDIDRNFLGITTALKYEARATDLANKIAQIIPGSGGTGQTVGYTRTTQGLSQQEAGTAGRAILEADPFQRWLTTDSQPTSPGLQVGRWRLWVEDRLITYQDFWLPNTTPPAGAIVPRGVGYENPCSDYVSQTTSRTSLSGASKTSTSSNSASASQTSLASTSISSSSSSLSSLSQSLKVPNTSSSAIIKSTRSGTIALSTLLTSTIPAGSSSSIPSITSTSSSSYSQSSSPPITSCTLSYQAALSTGAINIPATIACACNDGWAAGVGTTIGADMATTYTCEVGSTRIAVSTKAPSPSPPPPPPPPAPYATGTCNLHIFEASASLGDPLYVSLSITDNSNTLLTRQNYKLKWGGTATVLGKDSKLPYDFNVDFLQNKKTSRAINKRIGAPVQPNLLWEQWIVGLSTGPIKWDSSNTDNSKMPYCSVGGWDNGNFLDFLDALTSLGADSDSPNRQMDCRWAC